MTTLEKKPTLEELIQREIEIALESDMIGYTRAEFVDRIEQLKKKYKETQNEEG